jgi:hypothetical protein
VTPPLYTDQDIRSEAAVCLLALSSLPTIPDILRWLPGAYVDSYREEDGSGQTWGDVLDNTGLADVARKIHDLIAEAIPLPQWAIGLHADRLEPSDEHVITLDGGGKPIVRIHFAFEPGMPEEMRTALVEGIGQSIEAAL